MNRETVEITINKNNYPYHTCPKCGYKDITRPFNICLGCKVWIKWVKNKVEAE